MPIPALLAIIALAVPLISMASVVQIFLQCFHYSLDINLSLVAKLHLFS